MSKQKESPAKIMKRLLQLSKRMRKDETAFENTRKEWYNKYRKSGVLEFLKSNNLSNVCSEYDLVYAVLPDEHIQRAIGVVAEQVIKNTNEKLDKKAKT